MAREVPSTSSETLLVAIKINGIEVGTIDPAELTVEAQMDLEEGTSIGALVQWLHKHAGADVEKAKEALRPIKMRELPGVYQAIGEALKRSIQIPN